MKKVICLLIILLMTNIFSSCTENRSEKVTNTEPPSDTYVSETEFLSEKDTLVTETVTKEPAESESEPETSAQNDPSSNTPPSLLDLILTAKEPVGKTMYVWGGGWNEEDTGAGIEAVTLGSSSAWLKFAEAQDASYDHKAVKYQIHNGLDCSGYLGWVIYNTLESESGKDGYVMKSGEMAEKLSAMGLGEYISASELEECRPGDIMSMKGHVWLSLGECADGSVLILHSSPPGVMFCGTALPDGGDSDAVRLAKKIMSENYPDWYARFKNCRRPYSYITGSSAMRWNRETLSDDENIFGMSAEEVAQFIFSEDF